MAQRLSFVLRFSCRGLLISAAGGLYAGTIEASRLLTGERVRRAGLAEAAVYAVVVDGLLFALCGGLLALALGSLAATAQRIPRRAPRVWSAAYDAVLLSFLLAFLLLLGAKPPLHPTTVDLQHFAAAAQYAGSLGLAGGVAWFCLATETGCSAAFWPHPLRALPVAGVVVLALGLAVPAQIVADVHARSASPPGGGSRIAELSSGGQVPPNIIVITVDALRADSIGACGNETAHTPVLDALAAKGVLFCHALVAQPQTNPSLASLFTGLYPWTAGVRMHMVDRLSSEFPTLATRAAERGYTTGGFIPWPSLQPAFSGLHQGFQVYDVNTASLPRYLRNPYIQASAGIYRRVKDQLLAGRMLNLLLQLDRQVERDIDGRADLTTSAAVAWLASSPPQPLLLWVHYFDPHYPWTPPPPFDRLYDDMYTGEYDGSMQMIYRYTLIGDFAPGPRDIEHLKALYAGEVSFTDAQIGVLLEELERHGLLRNAVLVITADHGESLGEHDEWLHGDELYNVTIRVPLIFVAPDRLPAGLRIDAIVRTVDVAPTLAELAGWPAARSDGASLLPLIRGEEEVQARRAYSAVGDDVVVALTTGDFWKLILNYRRGQIELYDLASDPEELHNRAASEPARTRELYAELTRWYLGISGRSLDPSLRPVGEE
jgi:arylsulfatase A-like enzyme